MKARMLLVPLALILLLGTSRPAGALDDDGGFFSRESAVDPDTGPCNPGPAPCPCVVWKYNVRDLAPGDLGDGKVEHACSRP
jgi:hypothetical protein